MRRLAAALAATPRRHRMPPLPADAEAARSAPPEFALAFAVECARSSDQPDARALFATALGALVMRAAEPVGGDPAFQALLLGTGDASVREFVALQARAAGDARTVRRLVDAVAHPGKLGGAGEAQHQELASLHELARAARWNAALHHACGLDAPLAGHPALQRLARLEALRALPAVERYSLLARSHGPAAGSEAASRHGREAAQAGAAAEALTVAALTAIARALQDQGVGGLRVARGLKTPAAFPGDRRKAKDEWDVALIAPDAGGARIALLGEVKASPAAAWSDSARLQRGLQGFAQAEAATAYSFPSADGPVEIAGASLRELAPAGRALPPNVVYFSPAPAGPPLPPLSAASKAVLLREPGCLAFARTRDASSLLPVWDALRTEPRLRATLHQYETGKLVCAALLHPEDLLLAVERGG